MPLTDSGVVQKSLLREYAEALGVALLLALLIRTFCVQAFQIPSESMLPTLVVGDRLLVNKFLYGVKWPFTHTYIFKGSEPQRNDVIVFQYPRNPDIDYIKRIVGVPGDVIEVRNKQLIRNGQPVDEPFIRHSDRRVEPVRDNFGPVKVPEGQYFVMGDNRDNSQDSRFWGFVERSAIHGKAWRIYWSSTRVVDLKLDRLGKAIK